MLGGYFKPFRNETLPGWREPDDIWTLEYKIHVKGSVFI